MIKPSAGSEQDGRCPTCNGTIDNRQNIAFNTRCPNGNFHTAGSDSGAFKTTEQDGRCPTCGLEIIWKGVMHETSGGTKECFDPFHAPPTPTTGGQDVRCLRCGDRRWIFEAPPYPVRFDCPDCKLEVASTPTDHAALIERVNGLADDYTLSLVEQDRADLRALCGVVGAANNKLTDDGSCPQVDLCSGYGDSLVGEFLSLHNDGINHSCDWTPTSEPSQDCAACQLRCAVAEIERLVSEANEESSKQGQRIEDLECRAKQAKAVAKELNADAVECANKLVQAEARIKHDGKLIAKEQRRAEQAEARDQSNVSDMIGLTDTNATLREQLKRAEADTKLWKENHGILCGVEIELRREALDLLNIIDGGGFPSAARLKVFRALLGGSDE